MSSPQHEEQCKRHKLPPSGNLRECGAHFKRNASQGRMPVQQEGYKTLQQVIRDQVVSEVNSIDTTMSLDDEVEHWEQKEATASG